MGTLATRFSSVAVESTRDSYINGPWSQAFAGYGYTGFDQLLWETAAHEVGHEFGALHTNGSLMGPAEQKILLAFHFSTADRALIRSRVESPGEAP